MMCSSVFFLSVILFVAQSGAAQWQYVWPEPTRNHQVSLIAVPSPTPTFANIFPRSSATEIYSITYTTGAQCGTYDNGSGSFDCFSNKPCVNFTDNSFTPSQNYLACCNGIIDPNNGTAPYPDPETCGSIFGSDVAAVCIDYSDISASSTRSSTSVRDVGYEFGTTECGYSKSPYCFGYTLLGASGYAGFYCNTVKATTTITPLTDLPAVTETPYDPTYTTSYWTTTPTVTVTSFSVHSLGIHPTSTGQVDASASSSSTSLIAVDLARAVTITALLTYLLM